MTPELQQELDYALGTNAVATINDIARHISAAGCPLIVLALPPGKNPLVVNSIDVATAGQATVVQVVTMLLRALGMNLFEANNWALLAAPKITEMAQRYAAQRAAQQQAAHAAGRTR